MRGAFRGALALAVTMLLGVGPAVAQECAGDCDEAEGVGVHEILRCVAVGLGQVALAECDACDADGDTEVAVNELVVAVENALRGCPDAPRPSAVARFALPAAGTLDWGVVPFPSDLYRDASGAIRIGRLPVAEELPLHAAMREVVQTRDGFCATCNVYFPLDGDIDPASLPAGDEPSAGDAVLLADVDPDSPERGRLFPLRIEWDAERARLAIRPVRGIALHRSRRYAAVLTTALRAADGTPLGASETFRAARRRTTDSRPAVERARGMLAPAFDELEAVGIGRTRIVAMAAYTTEDVTADVLGARAAVQSGAPPEVVIERRRRGAEIDALLGIPGEDRPGIDVPPAAGQAGSRSIVHTALDEVITGVFVAPRLVGGSGIDIGTVRRDGSGAIIAGPREPVPFVLTLPREAVSPLPVLIAHHGFSASRTTGFATANTAARTGVAVLAIDGFQHGDRAASAVDTLHAVRGNVAGGDGFAETVALDVTGRVFGVIGAPEGLELFPGYSHGAFMQFEADVASAVRIVRDGSLAAALQAAGVESAAFDAQRIGYIGNSLGAVVGASVLTAEPDVRFAVQNVPPGSIVETLAESPEFRPLVDALFLPLMGVVGPFDEINRQLIFEPLVDLSRWILEPIDPLALAPYLITDPVRPEPADILFQYASLDEVASALATASMLEATGSTQVTRYDPAAHSMLEVLDQISRFEPPAAPPYVMRATPLPVLNPLVAEHDEIATFLARQLEP